MEQNQTLKKVFGIILKVFTWIVVAFTVGIMIFTIVSVTTLDRNDRSIFGIKFYIVQTDSMSKSENNADLDVHFNAGDIVLIKNVKDPYALQVGDIISFISTNEVSYGETVTHMIRERKTDTEGKLLGYVTYGTNTGTNDEALVEPEFILGQYTGKLPWLGRFFQFMKTVPGYIVCILIPFLLIIGYNGANTIRLFRRYKREQMEEMQAERSEIEAQRAEMQAMMAEMQAMREQLARQQQTDAVPPPAEGASAASSDVGEDTAQQ